MMSKIKAELDAIKKRLDVLEHDKPKKIVEPKEDFYKTKNYDIVKTETKVIKKK